MTKIEKANKILAVLNDKGKVTDDLDGLVHDAASEIATETNNSGIEKQVEFLLDNGWTPEDILGRLEIKE